MPESTPTPAPDDATILRTALAAELRAATATTPDGRPGWKTTEFWTHLFAQLVGAAIVAWGMYRESDMLVLAGGVMTGGSQLGYALARVLVKRATAAAAPLMLAVVLLAIGCVPVEAIQHCDMQARNAYGLMRAAPSEDGRGVASDELEAWRWQRIMLTGDDAIPPPGVTYPPLPELAAQVDAATEPGQ